jgi:endonuclease/exonuclease/phosphatase family metal-dependent hydrolase
MKQRATSTAPSRLCLTLGNRRRLVLCLLAGCLGACSETESDTDASTDGLAVSFLTFNTALIAQTGNLEARLDVIAADLPKTNADAVCLQELWQPEHLEAFASRVKSDYPYAHWSVRESGESSGCTKDETATLIGCLTEYCSEVAADQMTACAVTNCANEFTGVSTGCQNCVLNNQALPPTEIATTCESSESKTTAYENQSGLLLLSKYPLKKKDYLALESSFGDRGVLSATIETELLPSVNLFCTHLAATQSGIEYPGEYDSWAGERAVQIDRTIKLMDDRKTNKSTSVLMGDLNCGPGGDGFEGEDTDGFSRLLDAGFTADYLDSTTTKCTFCKDNDLVGADSSSVLIDHVLFSDLPDSVTQTTTRVFDDSITLDVDGKTLETHRSDHYGLAVTVTGK